MTILRTDLIPEELTDMQRIVVQNVLSEYTSGLPKDVQPYLDRRPQHPRPVVDIDGFFDLVKTVVDEQQVNDEIDEDKKIKLLHDFQPQAMEMEVITHSVIKREPASMSKGGPFNQGTVEYKPRVRGIEDDPAKPGYRTIILGQKMENIVGFTCWAKTNKQADYRVRWLEKTMREWTWYIRYNGIDDCFFVGQDEDFMLTTDLPENRLMGRRLRYYVRTESYAYLLEPVVKRIIIKYGLASALNID